MKTFTLKKEEEALNDRRFEADCLEDMKIPKPRLTTTSSLSPQSEKIFTHILVNEALHNTHTDPHL